jgi:hypothetical protein
LRHFARGRLQLLAGSAYRRAQLLKVIRSLDSSPPQSCALRQPTAIDPATRLFCQNLQTPKVFRPG